MSYASPDRDRVVPFAEFLSANDFDVWIDTRRLLAGQTWDVEIRKALDRAAIIVVFNSSNSIDPRGYVQREIKLALEKAEEKLAGDIYVIPVLLDPDTPVPDELKSRQCVRAWERDAYQSIELAIRHQFTLLGERIQILQEKSKVRWSEREHSDSWDGLPGYDWNFNVLEFTSSTFKNVSDITHIIRGELMQMAGEERRVKFEQHADSFNFGQDPYLRTNTFEAHCDEPVITNRVLSLRYHLYVNGAGAAHGNAGFCSFNFYLDPVVRIRSLAEIFESPEEVLPVIQRMVRQTLREELELDGPLDDFGLEWITSGTADWAHFENFSFGETGVEILFPPYQIAAYAYGPRSSSVLYEQIFPHLKASAASALGVSHLRWQRSPS